MRVGLVVEPAAEPIFFDLADLVSIELVGHGIQLVERVQIQAILDEIELFQQLGDEGHARIALDGLLDAEGLVVLRPVPGPTDALDVFFIETRWGLRLFAERIVLDGDNVEQPAALAALIADRLRQSFGEIKAVVAVSPVKDQRLDRTPPYLSLSLTAVLRSVLESTPGVLTIELEQARALLAETTIRGERGLEAVPLITVIAGEIDSLQMGEGTFSIDLDARSTGRSLLEAGKDGVTSEEAAAFCAEFGQDLAARLIHDSTNPRVSSSGQRRPRYIESLMNQGNALASLGNFDQAVNVIETIALLRPDDPEVRWLAIDLIEDDLRYLEHLYRQATDIEAKREIRSRQFAHQRSGIEHMATYVRLCLALNRSMPQNHVYQGWLIAGWLRAEPEGAEYYEMARDRMYQVFEDATDEQLGRMSPNMPRAFIPMIYEVEPSYVDMRRRWNILERTGESRHAFVMARRLLGPMDREHVIEMVQLIDQMPPLTHGPTIAGVELARAFALTKISDHPPHTTRPKPFGKPPLPLDESSEHQEASPWGDSLMSLPVAEIELIELRPPPEMVEDSSKTIRPWGWVDAGRYGEIWYTAAEVFLLGESRELTRLFALPEADRWIERDRPRAIARPMFDGRYVWVAAPLDPARMAAIDLETLDVWRFGAEDGLPPMAGGVAIAPLSVGHVLVAGSTNAQRSKNRVWIADAKMDSTSRLATEVLVQYDDSFKFGRQRVFPFVDQSVVIADPDTGRQLAVFGLIRESPGWFDHACQVLWFDPQTREAGVFEAGRFQATFSYIEDAYHDANHLILSNSGPPYALYRVHPTGPRLEVIRPVYSQHWQINDGQDSDGMTYWSGFYVATGRERQVYVSRELDDVARPIARFEDVDPDRVHVTFVNSRLLGLLALMRDRDNTRSRDASIWLVDMPPIDTDGFNQPPIKPPFTKTYGNHEYGLFGASFPIEVAKRLAIQYQARLPMPVTSGQTRELATAFETLANCKLVWTALTREVDGTVRAIDGESIVGLSVQGEGDGPIALDTDKAQLRVIARDGQAQVMLDWPRHDEQALPSSDHHPGPMWMPLVELPAGSYRMGHSADDSPFAPMEVRREVDIPAGLWIGATEITVEQWNHVMRKGPMPHRAQGKPLARTWKDAQEFCLRLSAMTGLHYRLPSEEEWEYACRAGTSTRFASGDSEESLRRIGWCSEENKSESAGYLAYVASLDPNPWGIYDMHGNLAEHTSTVVSRDGNERIRPDQSDMSEARRWYVSRGGAWFDSPSRCRSSAWRAVARLAPRIGFRVILDTRGRDSDLLTGSDILDR